VTTTPSRGDTDQADTDPVRADPVRADPGGIDRVGPGRAVTRPPRPPADMRRHLPYTLPGLWFALAFTCLSFTPSLLPRSGLVQGLICGVNAAIGYGLGVFAAAAWRAVADRDARPPRSMSWTLLAVATAVALPIAVVLGRYWQDRIRDLMGVAPDSVVSSLLVLPVAAVVPFVALVAAARGLRWLYRHLDRRLRRWVGPRAADVLTGAIIVVGTALVVNGVLVDGAVRLADHVFSLQNENTEPGVTQPTTGLRSGGPASLVAWDSLGRYGRSFVARGPTAARIAAVRGGSAIPPIRAYAGLDSAATAEDRARLAVDDLERAGGFRRSVLVVATTTGSGWIDPASPDTLEYLTGGDCAVVTMQYSYLPSWLSYLVDQDRARDAGRELFDAVYARWSDLPQDARPRLFVYGESLGSFGAEAPFSGEFDLRNRTSGTLLVGPPAFNVLYGKFVRDRDPGSPAVTPVYRGGRTVRFSSDPDTPPPPADAPWIGPRVLYLLHPSDPVVKWSTDLVLQRPDWLAEPRGRDVVDAVRWIPFVTFWQVTFDLPFALDVPQGHGHTYSREYVGGWATVLRPAGWDQAGLDRLRDVIAPNTGAPS
jgi:uncharacterized membrane protein